jgi:hypothetical protein
MALTIACPGCMKRYTLDESMAGRTARCKDCGQVFAVPSPAGRAPSAPVAGAPKAAPPPTPAPSPRPSAPSSRTAPPVMPPRAATAVETSGRLDELFDEAEGGEEPVHGYGLPPARSAAYRRPSDGKALRLTLTIGGLALGLGLGLFGAYWLATNVAGRLSGGGAIAANPNAPAGAAGGDAAGWPVLGEPGLDLYPAGTNPKARPTPAVRRDVVDQAVRMTRRMLTLLNQMCDALATIHNGPTAQAAAARLQELQNQAQDMMGELRSMPNPTRPETREIVARIKEETRRTIDRLEAERQRLQSLPGGALGAMRMMPGIQQMSAGYDQMIREAEAGDAAAQPYVEVYIANVPDDEAAMLLSETLTSGAAKSTGNNSVYSGTHKAAVVRLWPVGDARAFAASIPFGEAEVTGHKIVVLKPRIDASAVAARAAAKRREEEDRRAEAAARERAEAERRAKEDPTPPPGADAITIAVTKLTSTNIFKVSEGLKELSRMIPKEGRHAEVVPALIPHATGTEHGNAIEAIKALANWKDDEAVRAMIHVIERSDDTFVRREAMQQLTRLKEASAAPAIAQRLTDDWPEAETCLRDMGEAAESAVIPLLKAGDGRMRRTACEVLRDVGGDAALDAMLALPPDPDASVRDAAIEAMQRIAQRLGPEAVKKLNRGGRRR